MKTSKILITATILTALSVGVFFFAKFQLEQNKAQIAAQQAAYLEEHHTIHFQNQLAKIPVKDLQPDNTIATLNQKFQLSTLAPKSAHFIIEAGEIKIIPEAAGIEINEQKLFRELKQAAANLQTTNIVIETTTVKPTITTADLEAQKDQILAKLNQKITLKDPIYSDDWNIKLIDHLDWLHFNAKTTVEIPFLKDIALADENGREIAIELDEEKLNLYIDENLSKWLNKPATSTKIFYDDAGKIKIEGQGKDGLEIQRQNLKTAIELALNHEIAQLEIPVYKTPATLDIDPKIQALGIKERIGQGHTSYYGSPTNRTHNIKVAAANFNGLLIEPGEEFSFNTNLGPVDASTGYSKELVIKQEGTIPEYGGGVCQVSTTMYRAALLTGLDITDRREHSYAVSYYSQILGHGLDATIYLGGQDLKFRNDTEHPILIHTYIDNDYELYVNFYGTADGRKVELAGPYIFNQRGPGATQYIDTPDLPIGQTKQVEKPHGGFSVDWNYKLFDGQGQLTKEETIETRYKSVPAKILVGTGA
ncbi:VanW family protein [Candidatus Gracilibacteria bacterium]|nr:VanW family protein [Candidatus Gracilibacteria bacterium]